MAISLNDLVRLRGDKGNFARIETLIGKRAAAEQAAAAASADLAKATDALRSLGIEVDDTGGGGGGGIGSGGGSGGRGKYGRRRGRPPGSKNKAKAAKVAAAPNGSKAGKAPKGAKRGPKPGSARRSGEDYVKALDEIGAEFTRAGKDDIRGPDLVKAMKERGFTSKQVVMNQVRDHKGWKRKGEKRAARYSYKG